MLTFANTKLASVRPQLIFLVLGGLCISLLAGCASRQPALTAISYQNPVYPGSLPDPSVFDVAH